MADALDLARDREQEYLDLAFKRFHAGRTKENNPDIYCIDCGDEISERRRAFNPGCLRCICCQGELEMRNKNRARLHP